MEVLLHLFISEAAVIICGLGFSRWSKSSPPKPWWDHAKKFDILGVEFARVQFKFPLFGIYKLALGFAIVSFSALNFV